MLGSNVLFSCEVGPTTQIGILMDIWKVQRPRRKADQAEAGNRVHVSWMH